MKIISDCVINGKKLVKLNRSKILPNSLVQEIENCALRPPSFLFMLFKAFNIAVFTLLDLPEVQTIKTGFRTSENYERICLK
jgi:hypothetical protein